MGLDLETQAGLSDLLLFALQQYPQSFQQEFLTLISAGDISPTAEMISSNEDSVPNLMLSLSALKFCIAYAGVGMVLGYRDKPKYLPLAIDGEGHDRRLAYLQSRIDNFEVLS